MSELLKYSNLKGGHPLSGKELQSIVYTRANQLKKELGVSWGTGLKMAWNEVKQPQGLTV
jgi:hypothetical protein